MSYSSILLALLSAFLWSCASVTVTQHAQPIPSERCNVKVHENVEAAKSKGPIDELCTINGTSVGAFEHDVEKAIEKHKHNACECGATNVYIESQEESDNGPARVTLVAFRYKDRNAQRAKKGTGDARTCRSTGDAESNKKCEVRSKQN